MEPIFTAHLFSGLDDLLLSLLRSLGPLDWEAQTVAPKWNVKDVAAHLLDTSLRCLSMGRDGYTPDAPAIASNADLVAFINRLNAEGVAMYRRLSPPVLISLIEVASKQLAGYEMSRDPFGTARFGVSWAGEERSLNWFDIAREYTERWHHQQQIRLVVDRPGILTPELYHPVLDCFLRALPFRYREVQADAGTLLEFNVSGECGGTWYLARTGESWDLVDTSPAVSAVAASVSIPQEIAWRVFTKGIDRGEAEARTTISGNREMGLHILGMTSIVG